MQRSVCVYCGSRMGHNPMHQQTARDLGRAMAQRNWQLIYGGGTVGLMGVLARSVLEYGGDVLGIIPQALYDREIALRESTRLIVTETMSQRKDLMHAYATDFVALPGGFGTFDELFETVTLRQLGYHQKPIIVLNIGGYYDPLLALFQHAVTQGYIGAAHIQICRVATTVQQAMTLLEEIGEKGL